MVQKSATQDDYDIVLMLLQYHAVERRGRFESDSDNELLNSNSTTLSPSPSPSPSTPTSPNPSELFEYPIMRSTGTISDHLPLEKPSLEVLQESTFFKRLILDPVVPSHFKQSLSFRIVWDLALGDLRTARIYDLLSFPYLYELPSSFYSKVYQFLSK